MQNISSGILIVNKPRGMTSHDVVNYTRHMTGIRKIGHAGTLDPLAEGLLIILIGDATKRQAEFMAGEKEYMATLRLGAISDTDDAEGRVEITNAQIPMPTKVQILECLKQFMGEIEQTPPIYSAIKLKGQKAYELARKGEIPELKSRKVIIREIELLEYVYPVLKIRVVCSPGTYLRALARDIGKKLRCGAYLEALTRTRSGNFRIEQAVKLQKLISENWQQYLVKI